MPIYSAATVSAPATVTTRTTTTKTTTVSSAPAAPASASASLPPLLTATAPPYGIPENDSLVKSPFSNFTISDIGMKPGTVIYDSYTGQPFRIP
jgi:hypothetical protein